MGKYTEHDDSTPRNLVEYRKRYGIRPLGNFVQLLTFRPELLISPGLTLTDVPYGPLEEFDAMRFETIWYSNTTRKYMVIVSNPNYPIEDAGLSSLQELCEQGGLYVRLDNEFHRSYAVATTLLAPSEPSWLEENQ